MAIKCINFYYPPLSTIP